MNFDMIGLLERTNVPMKEGLLPLFEAVVNGIHATQDRCGREVADKGRVDITVRRVSQGQLFSEEQQKPIGRPPIEKVEKLIVGDNGCGFTDANLESFRTAFSRHKVDIGGKGFGRFTWLKVFQEAHVDSLYEMNGQLLRRAFTFRATPKCVEEFSESAASAADRERPMRTRVELRGVHPRYADNLRRGVELVADRLFEHCFPFFIIGHCPKIRISEETLGEDASETILVNQKLADLTATSAQVIVVGEHELTVRHIQQRPTALFKQHMVHYCGNHRVVESHSLTGLLGSEPLATEQGGVIHHAFVSGPYLDDSVDNNRLRLDLPDDPGSLAAPGQIDKRSLFQALESHIEAHLSHLLKEEREANQQKVESYIRTVQPEYGHLLVQAKDRLAKVKFPEDRQELDRELYCVQQSVDLSVRIRSTEVLQKLERTDDTAAEVDKIADELYQVLRENGRLQDSNLIRYVLKRRAVLDLLTKLIGARHGGTRALEEHVHQAVFPMRNTGDEILFAGHNLWLVDDSLAFYNFVASDISFKKNKAAPVDSKERPDIMAFKNSGHAWDLFAHGRGFAMNSW